MVHEMIDYQKLQIAHKLGDEYCKKNEECLLDIALEFGYTMPQFTLSTNGIFERYIWIDELIQRLQELTAPKPKYAIGDYVWMVYLEEIYEFKILNNIGSKYILDRFKNGLVYESELHPTREALIQSQIDYWCSMRELKKPPTVEDIEQESCQHESEGSFSHDGGLTETNKCKKCGEFY